MRLLRLWLWLMPVVILAAAVVFGWMAAADGRWGLFGVMVGMGVLGVALLVFHYWILQRFGAEAPR
jgi:hypothetical protein